MGQWWGSAGISGAGLCPEVAHDAQILIATGNSHPPAAFQFTRRHPVPKAQTYLACVLATY